MNGISKCYLFKYRWGLGTAQVKMIKKGSLEKAAFGLVLGALYFFFNIKQTIFMKNTYLLNTCETLEIQKWVRQCSFFWEMKRVVGKLVEETAVIYCFG